MISKHQKIKKNQKSPTWQIYYNEVKIELLNNQFFSLSIYIYILYTHLHTYSVMFQRVQLLIVQRFIYTNNKKQFLLSFKSNIKIGTWNGNFIYCILLQRLFSHSSNKWNMLVFLGVCCISWHGKNMWFDFSGITP